VDSLESKKSVIARKCEALTKQSTNATCESKAKLLLYANLNLIYRFIFVSLILFAF